MGFIGKLFKKKTSEWHNQKVMERLSDSELAHVSEGIDKLRAKNELTYENMLQLFREVNREDVAEDMIWGQGV